MTDTNAQTGQQIQLKHQFYVLTLCFTILALAVETAEFNGPLAAATIELTGWFCLLISGFIGLFRFELIPNLYQLFDVQMRLKQDKSELQKAAFLENGEILSVPNGRNVPISELLIKISANLSKAEEVISDRNKKITARYLMHRWLFVAGVVFIVASRGYEPAKKIVDVMFCNVG